MSIEAELRYLVSNQRLLLKDFSNPMIMLQYDLIKLMHTVDIETTNNLGPCYGPWCKPLLSAKDLLVYIPLSHAFCDGYIDDLIAMAVDLEDNVHRSQQALPLSAHSISRPIHNNDDPNRKDTLSLRKFSGKGRPDETKTILGWDVDTWAFRISFSEDKYKLWMVDIETLLTKDSKHKAKTIESTIGRLNHVDHIRQPHSRYVPKVMEKITVPCNLLRNRY